MFVKKSKREVARSEDGVHRSGILLQMAAWADATSAHGVTIPENVETNLVTLESWGP